MTMSALVACEESQRVTIELRKLGVEAYSCDIQDCSSGHPEWHHKGNVLPLLDGDCTFTTVGGQTVSIEGKWDLIIAHPPCTYLSNVATRHHSLNCTPLEKINERTMERLDAARFFMRFATANCDHVVIENPVGIMNTVYRAPDQIIEPYQFAPSINSPEYVTKRTCLWLKDLPPLIVNALPRPNNHKLFGTMPSGKAKTWEDSYAHSAKERSKTFPGIARAMAEQWVDYIRKQQEV